LLNRVPSPQAFYPSERLETRSAIPVIVAQRSSSNAPAIPRDLSRNQETSRVIRRILEWHTDICLRRQPCVIGYTESLLIVVFPLLPMTSVNAYAKEFGALTESAFETEACIRLEHTVSGFQRVPPKPQGDGGLDGFSHKGTRGYCCYGPIPTSFTKPKDLEKAIVAKFSSDLRRLCEVDTQKTSLIHKANEALPNILPVGAKLAEIVLICNWFESHKVIGPLHTALPTYLKASKCNFVSPEADVQIIGPVEFAQRYYADELALYSLRSRTIIEKVKTSASTLALAPPQGFDAKMATLKLIRPGKDAVIDGLAENFRHDWRMNLAFEQELDETLPDLHRALQDGRRRILTRVNQRMLSSSEPWNELPEMVAEAREILRVEFGAYANMVDDVSNGEIARLIGICPIDWEAS
jgi:hypothetical protein